ncbi:MAG: glycosyltransferase family 2 protein [Deltaproteobacteria bacterium]|nr:glycosyltransferase family 2 protein [Deltaproteobacteria bacterium]MDL1961618.1 glycosyltransferase family 2 protein [Deltaproteobacteria bacterium]
MKFGYALRPGVLKQIERIETTDIVMGIPCYNNEDTIAHVIETVSGGIYRHFPDAKALIFVSDGGSTDDTREMAESVPIKPGQERVISIYRGLSGKGSAMRAVFEAARILQAKACATVDSDLRSITHDWIKSLLDPVMEKGYDFVAPIYYRHKYDGTITNNIAYSLTRALYGRRIRQPIGGDFAFSNRIIKNYLSQDVWMTDVARFGVDIWLTTIAITEGFNICQARLGVKIHQAKDPGESLGPMFRQVVGTIFALMSVYKTVWKEVHGSMPVDTFGPNAFLEPDPIEMNLKRLIVRFKDGMTRFGPLYQSIFSPEVYRNLKESVAMEEREFTLSLETWVKGLYEIAATYDHWRHHQSDLLTVMVPLYLGRVASFVNKTRDMDSFESEKVVEQQAEKFERLKDYLIHIWDNRQSREDVVDDYS